jgi:hypothetical protein
MRSFTRSAMPRGRNVVLLVKDRRRGLVIASMLEAKR